MVFWRPNRRSDSKQPYDAWLNVQSDVELVLLHPLHVQLVSPFLVEACEDFDHPSYLYQVYVHYHDKGTDLEVQR